VADVVDHVQPHRGDVGLFLDPGNLAAMCSSCHSRKTAREVGYSGRHE
jgi:5-methylcytosine-specific restriction protein A